MDSSATLTDANPLSLEEQVARLHALLEASRRVHSSIASHQVLNETACILVRELEMEGALLLEPGIGVVLASYGNTPQFPFAGCGTFPLVAKDGTVLAQLIVKPAPDSALTLYEQDFIEGLVLQAAVALENAMLHERDLEWTRVQRDLEAARGIQRSLLPRSMPGIAGFSLASRSVTCYEVGGDYLDVLTLPDGSFLFIVADVAGKGLASAIVATSFRSAFRSLAGGNLPLAEVVHKIGNQHWDEGPEARRRYVTAILGRLYPAESRIEIVNAGHNPGLLVQPDGSVTHVESSGTPLGLLPSMGYTAESFPFPAGSRLLLYTDGLTEVFCGEEEFGCDRLSDLFRSSPFEDAGQILDTLWQTLQQFAAGSPQSDDMTALAIYHTSTPTGENGDG